MKRRWNWNKMRRKAPLFAIMVLAGAAACGGTAGLVARYVHQQSESAAALSNQFYFTSDYLSETGNSYTLAPGTTAITIQLRNYADDYRWSDMDIKYKVSVTGESQSETLEGLSYENTGTLQRADTDTGGTKQNLTISGLKPGTYHVTAESTSPFVQSLRGSFTVQEQDQEVHYSVSDSEGSLYIILRVSTKEYGDGVTINWPAGLIPDSSETVFENVTTYNEATGNYSKGQVTIEAFGRYGSESYRFFKEDTTKTYQTGDFQVTKTAQQ